MTRQKKALAVVVGIAALLLGIAFVVNKSIRRAHDDTSSTAVEESPPKMDSAEPVEDSPAAFHQDKTSQESPREESESPIQASGIDPKADEDDGISWHEAAREYDRNGQIGEPPEGWRTDYSHWDLQYSNTNDLEKIGLVDEGTGGTSFVFKPTEEARLRMTEIHWEIGKATEEGLLTQESKSGYVRREFLYSEMAVYAAPDFVEHLDALLKEMKQINEQHMQETSDGAGFMIFSEVFTSPEYSKVAVRYYRREDGSLMREVTLPSGEMKTFVAGPPPDLSGYSEAAIEYMKDIWGGTEKTQTSGDSHAYSFTLTPITDP